jgi:hypothetical protein
MLLHICGCGHEFIDVRAMSEELQEQVRIGWSYVAMGATALLACAAIAIATSAMWFIGTCAGVALILRGFMTRADARSQLSHIRKAAGALPRVNVVPSGRH